jgi:hypothetical protein
MVREISIEGRRQVRLQFGRLSRKVGTLTRRKLPEQRVEVVGVNTPRYTSGPPQITAKKLDVPTRGMREELDYLMKVMPPTLPRTDSVIKPGA